MTVLNGKKHGYSDSDLPYHVIQETMDILYDYSDTSLVGKYPTLSEANEAARAALQKEQQKEEGGLGLTRFQPVQEIVKDGGVVLTTGNDEVELTISVKHHSLLSGPSRESTAIFVATKVITDVYAGYESRTLVGVFRAEENANSAAERELRSAAGINDWRDRRRLGGAYREEYGLEGLFEGELKTGDRKGIKVIVEETRLQ